MSYPPAPGTTGSSLPPKPPTPSGGANSNGNSPANGGGSGLGGGFTKKSSFKPAGTTSAASFPQQPAPQQYSSAAPGGSYRATPPTTYGPTAPPPAAQQYGPSYTSYSAAPGTSAVSAPSYQYPQQQQTSYQSSNWNTKQSNWQTQNRPQQSNNANYSQQPTRYNQNQQSYGPQSNGSQGYGAQNYGQAPHIQNPFNKQSGAPGGGQGEYGGGGDGDMAAQIAQWQSAYVSKDAAALDKDGKPIEQPRSVNQPYGAASIGPGNYNAYNEAANNNVPDANPDKKKTVVRHGGGKKWEDETLLEWNPDHPRLFVGNLAGETTDESLLKAFSRWSSVVKTRVIRDKRTSKSKGYGFVSFSNVDEFFNAAKEMNGKYIQSHPVIVKKATAEIKGSTVKDKNQRYKGNNNRHGNGDRKKENGAPGGEYSPSLGPKPGGGVGKPGKKTKNGLRLLG